MDEFSVIYKLNEEQQVASISPQNELGILSDLAQRSEKGTTQLI